MQIPSDPRLASAFALATDNQDRASASQKASYDTKIKFSPFQPGLVWRDDPAKSRIKLAP